MVFKLTNEEVSVIEDLNSQKTSLRGILADDSIGVEIKKLILPEYTKVCKEYDKWFARKQEELNVSVTEKNSWTVNFSNKELILN